MFSESSNTLESFGDLEAVVVVVVGLLSDVDGAGDGVEDGGEEVLEGAQVVTDCSELKSKMFIKLKKMKIL